MLKSVSVNGAYKAECNATGLAHFYVISTPTSHATDYGSRLACFPSQPIYRASSPHIIRPKENKCFMLSWPIYTLLKDELINTRSLQNYQKT